MSKLRCSITMSIDGFVAGPNQSAENPIGEGGLRLHDWVFATKTFRALHGEGDGGESGINDDVFRESFDNVGSVIMGRNMFGPVRGPWVKDAWKGWWGENPPFNNPVYVLTHYEREALPMRGGTTFHFVTNGIESALNQARNSARGRDVVLGGGASTIQQFLSAGLIDEMEIHVVPALLGVGERLFDRVDLRKVKLQPLQTIAGPGVTHIKYRVVKNAPR